MLSQTYPGLAARLNFFVLSRILYLILPQLMKMRFTILSTITALAAATLTSATPLEARQDTLLPFEVTQVFSERRSPALGPECTNPLIPTPILYKSHSLPRENHHRKLHRPQPLPLLPGRIRPIGSGGSPGRQLRNQVVQR